MFLVRPRALLTSRAVPQLTSTPPHRALHCSPYLLFLSAKKEVTATTTRKPTTVVASPRPKGALRFEHKHAARPSKNVVTALTPTAVPPPAPYIVKKRHSFVYRFFKSIFTRWGKQQRLARHKKREERKKKHLAGQPKGRDIARLLYYYRATRKPYYFKHWLRMSGYNTRKIWQSIKTKSETFVAEKLTQNNEPLDLSETNLAPTITAYPTYSRMLPDGTHEVDIKGTISVPGEWTSRKNRFILNMVRSYLSGNSEEKLEKDIAALEELERERQGRMSTRGFRSTERSSHSTPDLIDLDDGASISSASSRASSVREGYESPSRRGGRTRGPPPPPSRIYSSRTTSSTISVETTTSTASTDASLEDTIMKERFAPFVAQPLVNAVLDVTIIDEKDNATSTTLHSHTSGKFGTAVRLGFKPTIMKIHVRNTPYAVQQDLMDVSYEGISLISDIDDTIKHTGVTGDKKAMIKNVFVKDLDGLSIPGVVEWYNKLSSLGVQTHYVSNSPWQLYPVIKEYLLMHGFPKGSIHLKDYAGVLSQLFEAPAERKKFNLEQILRDFPQRRFILVGDSGEGDLEAYVELAKVYPQQVLGIYIRDITSDRELDYDFLRVEIAALKEAAEQGDLKERSMKVARKPVNLMDAPIGKKVPPPVPRKPVGLSGKKTDENADHSGKLDSASSNAAIAATAAFGAPPLPPRRKIQPETMRSISDQVSSGSVNVSASQETDETPRMYSDNDRQFKWKERVRRARRELPANVRLRLWKQPPRVEGETLELAKMEVKEPVKELL
ncbi:Phosphatidate phosphatase APP1 [Yarrowia sp. B02]|nr:Phosphatidate phosphatase APP1 [Yarrowia sp. B02]